MCQAQRAAATSSTPTRNLRNIRNARVSTPVAPPPHTHATHATRPHGIKLEQRAAAAEGSGRRRSRQRKEAQQAIGHPQQPIGHRPASTVRAAAGDTRAEAYRVGHLQSLVGVLVPLSRLLGCLPSVLPAHTHKPRHALASRVGGMRSAHALPAPAQRALTTHKQKKRPATHGTPLGRRDAQGMTPMTDAHPTTGAQCTPATAVAALRCPVECSCSCSFAPSLEQPGQQRCWHPAAPPAAVASGDIVEPATAPHPTAAAALALCTPCRPRPRVSHKQTQGRT